MSIQMVASVLRFCTRVQLTGRMHALYEWVGFRYGARAAAAQREAHDRASLEQKLEVVTGKYEAESE